ncbi:MAG: helix-turn-helix transcriptional regulator [Gammaproteobacteria bacterium]
MMDQFSKILLDLYRGTCAVSFSEFQEWALNLIKPAFGFDSGFWGMGGVNDQGAFINSIHLHQQPPEMMQAYESVREVDLVAEKVAAQPGRTVYVSVDDFVAAGPKYNSARAHVERWGMLHILCTGIIDPNSGLFSIISLYRADVGNPYTEEQRLLKERLMPHLAEAYIAVRQRHLERLALVEPVRPREIAIVDREHIVHDASANFWRLLNLEWSGCAGPKLPELLGNSLRGLDRARYMGTAIIALADRVSDLVFIVVREKSRLDELSPREYGVARLLSQGRSYKEIARTVGLSPITVRNHIQAVYAKLAVDNKVDLARVLNCDNPITSCLHSKQTSQLP